MNNSVQKVKVTKMVLNFSIMLGMELEVDGGITSLINCLISDVMDTSAMEQKESMFHLQAKWKYIHDNLDRILYTRRNFEVVRKFIRRHDVLSF